MGIFKYESELNLVTLLTFLSGHPLEEFIWGHSGTIPPPHTQHSHTHTHTHEHNGAVNMPVQ